MHDVMICLVSERDFKARLVQRIMGSKYNHVFLEFYSGDWRNKQAIDVTERGVTQLPASKTGYRDGEVVRFIAKESIERGLRETQALIGNRYDWAGLFGGLFKLLMLKWFGWAIKSPWHSKGRLFCSEYVAMVLSVSDPDDYRLEPWMSRPTDIMRYARLHLKRADERGT